MNTLYIIGNGFDLHHGIPCLYSDFSKWLKEKYPDMYYDIEEKYGADGEWWNEFEARLGNMDVKALMESVKDCYPKFASDDYRDRDKYVMPDTMHYTLESFMAFLRRAFREWVEELPDGEEEAKVSLDKSAHFLTFNYTDTLEQLYHIDTDNITHIHGRAPFAEELVVGHGLTDDEIRKFVYEYPEDGLEPEELERWYDAHYDPIKEETRDSIFNAIVSLRKDTEQVIADNHEFFSEARYVRHIKVMGHSMNDIDRPYFKALVENANYDIDWVVYWHQKREEERFRDFLVKLGVPTEYITLRHW